MRIIPLISVGGAYPADTYLFKVNIRSTRKRVRNMFKVNNKNTRTMSGASNVSFAYISHLFLVYLLLL